MDTSNIENNVQDVIDLIASNGGVDGAHHKQWVLDQILQILMTPEEYTKWVKDYEESDPTFGVTYEWDRGIAP